MIDLIDRKEVLQRICAACSNMGSFACMSCKIPGIVKGIPKIKAEPVRRGRWIEVTKHRGENGTILTDYECSECFAMLKDSYPEEIEEERFCYNCGARMELEGVNQNDYNRRPD